MVSSHFGWDRTVYDWTRGHHQLCKSHERKHTHTAAQTDTQAMYTRLTVTHIPYLTKAFSNRFSAEFNFPLRSKRSHATLLERGDDTHTEPIRRNRDTGLLSSLPLLRSSPPTAPMPRYTSPHRTPTCPPQSLTDSAAASSRIRCDCMERETMLGALSMQLHLPAMTKSPHQRFEGFNYR